MKRRYATPWDLEAMQGEDEQRRYFAERKRQMKIQEDTRTIGMGALTFNVSLAKAHGWSHRDIEKVWERFAHLMHYYGEKARKRNPELYGPHGEFIGSLPQDTED